jgi:hypothetical protein
MKSLAINPTKNKTVNWEKIPDREVIYSADDMINAWENGKAYYNNYVRDVFAKNVSQIKKRGETFFEELNHEKNRSRALFLKIDSINSFGIIFLLDKDIYSDDDRAKAIYEKSWKIEKEFDKKKIILCISFMPYSENINMEHLVADGYTSFYGKL